MLQLIDICKSYLTADFSQTALDHVSVSFRDCEFATILGPSGSGKTTLLNIIGGLDHYDSGNLLIDGISTEDYTDRDWDAYRNNRIGFVFQNYNLIPHQSVLSNVELALALSGVAADKRHERALNTLDLVGLKQHANKKPHQLSGGQMQRVAIARALVNDPEILLADEPTGALDSKTSVQIMDLLAEIAKDRLVIMVTHNPDLAQTYATRTVFLADGAIQSDTDTFCPPAQPLKCLPTSKAAKGRCAMSPLTAYMLSFNNLMTKKARTLMTAFAGSIGIIGIAAILALANGVNDYIKSVEEETLCAYPLHIQSSGFDMTSMMLDVAEGKGGTKGKGSADGQQNESKDTTTPVVTVLTSMFSSVGANDLASLKRYLDGNGGDIDHYTQAVEYSYSIAPLIYSADATTPRQLNPDTSFAALGLGSTVSSNSFMSMSMSTNTFYEMPSNPELYRYQYDVKAGRWPENFNEVVLVLTPNGGISDFMLYTLGMRDAEELKAMILQFASEEEVSVPEITEQPTYGDIMDVSFKLIGATDLYVYDDEFGVWKDKSQDCDYMNDVVENGEDIHLVGIVQPRKEIATTMLKPGLNYPRTLVTHVIEQAANSTIVQEQLKNPKINVFTGKPFGEENNTNSFSTESLFSIDGETLKGAISIDKSKLSTDMSQALNVDVGGQDMPRADMPSPDDILNNVDITLPADKVSALITTLMQNYMRYLQEFYAANSPVMPNPAYDKADPTSSPVIPNPAYDPTLQPQDAQTWLSRPDVSAFMTQEIQNMIDQGALKAQLATSLKNYVQSVCVGYMDALAKQLQAQTGAALQAATNNMAHNMAQALSIDASKFKKAFRMNVDEEELHEILMSLMSTEEASYDNNLKKLGYATLDKPTAIDIYPKDFESKEEVINILDTYNDLMVSEGSDDKVITYTDFVGALMSSITDIVNMISYVLVAFVAISLVVSSIMIGVITYISVLERTKEIGILRSIGASKKDIGRVFNAETIIVGFAAGVMGIVTTLLLIIPVNAIAYSLFAVPRAALLPWQAALTLIAISTLLTFLAGLIPSRAASRKDPVEALRSE